MEVPTSSWHIERHSVQRIITAEKWTVEGVAEGWQSGRVAEWQSGRVAEWQTVRVAE